MGFSPERFLNLCSNHNILLWDLKNVGDTYEMSISLRAFKQLKPLLKKTKTKLIIIEKQGLPFFLHRYRKRKVFFLGILCSAVLLYLLSSFIWNIHIEGNYSQTTEVILEYLEEEGISHGIWKDNVNCKDIATILRARFNDIIWVSAKIEGTRLIIDVQENTDTQLEETVEYEPSDLVANKDGIVTSIITRAGIPQVTVGDIVNVDDLLILGRLDITDDSQTVIRHEYVPADADIYIQTSYTYNDEFSLTYESKEFTGNVKKIYFIKLFDKSFGLFPKKSPYDTYDTVEDETQLKLTENFYLPIHMGTTELKQYETVTKKYTEEEAIALANENLNLFNEKLMEKGVQISQNNVKIDVDEESCKASGEIVVIEKIGKRVETEIAEILDSPEEGTADNEYN